MEGNDLADWFFMALALAVYFDATHHAIGKIKGTRGLLNMSAGGWATGASLTYVGIVVAGLYIVRRNRLIEKAQEHPVQIHLLHRIVVSFLLFVLPMGITYMLPAMLPASAQMDLGQIEQALHQIQEINKENNPGSQQ